MTDVDLTDEQLADLVVSVQKILSSRVDPSGNGWMTIYGATVVSMVHEIQRNRQAQRPVLQRQGRTAWDVIADVPPAPEPLAPTEKPGKIHVRVYHSTYGCDTGCCGHYVEVTMPDGSTREDWNFEHPYGPEHVAWARKLAEDSIRSRWPECLPLIDWASITLDVNST